MENMRSVLLNGTKDMPQICAHVAIKTRESIGGTYVLTVNLIIRIFKGTRDHDD